MYNAELKEKFLIETSKSDSTIQTRTSIFNFFQRYEEENDIDLCAMDAADIQAILDESMHGVRSRSAGTAVSTIRSYIRWCIGNGIVGAKSSGLKVTSNDIERMKRTTVKNPMHLKKFLNDVFGDRPKTTDEPCKCFFWLAFGGYEESEVMNITREHVDFANGIIRNGDFKCNIYKEGLDTIKSCVEDTEFEYINSNYVNSGNIWRSRVPGDCILRGVRGSSKPDLSIFRSNISRRVSNAYASNKTDLKLNYYKVWLSGAFYRMRELDDAGILGDAHFRSLTKEYIDIQHKMKHYVSKANEDPEIAKREQIMFNRKVSEYKKDYENWKMTIF